MKAALKKFMYWATPAFLLWITLSGLNARMYEKGLREHKFASNADSISIPIFNFAVVAGIIILVLTLFIYGLSFIAKKISPKYAACITLSVLLVMGTGFWIPFQKFTHEQTRSFVSQDMGYGLPGSAELVYNRVPLGFELDEYSCAVFNVPEESLGEIERKVLSEPVWKDFNESPPAEWSRCLNYAQGNMPFHLQTRTVDYREKKVLIGVDRTKKLLIHAYSGKLLPRND